MAKQEKLPLPAIGWREWVCLPELGIDRIKAKVDTGARSSSLHASRVEEFERDGEKFVRFQIHPVQRNKSFAVSAEAKILEYRSVRSSSGKSQMRPVIVTTLTMLDQILEIELTLANRDQMGFRMLLGREGVRGKFLVDSEKSYYGGRPPRSQRKQSEKTTADEAISTHNSGNIHLTEGNS